MLILNILPGVIKTLNSYIKLTIVMNISDSIIESIRELEEFYFFLQVDKEENTWLTSY